MGDNCEYPTENRECPEEKEGIYIKLSDVSKDLGVTKSLLTQISKGIPELAQVKIRFPESYKRMSAYTPSQIIILKEIVRLSELANAGIERTQDYRVPFSSIAEVVTHDKTVYSHLRRENNTYWRKRRVVLADSVLAESEL